MEYKKKVDINECSQAETASKDFPVHQNKSEQERRHARHKSLLEVVCFPGTYRMLNMRGTAETTEVECCRRFRSFFLRALQQLCLLVHPSCEFLFFPPAAPHVCDWLKEIICNLRNVVDGVGKAWSTVKLLEAVNPPYVPKWHGVCIGLVNSALGCQSCSTCQASALCRDRAAR